MKGAGSSVREYTVKCLDDCEFAVFYYKDFLKILAKIDERQKEDIIVFFQSTPYFSHWSRSMILKLLAHLNLKRVKKDQMLVNEG